MSRMVIAVYASFYAVLAFVLVHASALAQDVGDGLDQATPYQNWQVVIGFLLPLLMAVIIQSSWRREVQAVVTMLVAIGVTAAARYFMGEYGPIPQVLVEAIKVFAIAIPAYYGIWKPTLVAPKIEAATTI